MRSLSVAALLSAALALALHSPAQSVNASLPAKSPTDADLPNRAQLDLLLQAKRQPLIFQTDDVITVQIYGIDTYADKQRVGDDGTIVFPLIGRTQVAGLTTEQLQARIAQALGDHGMVRDAQVTVISELRPTEVVSVLGNVTKPGIYPAVGNLTLADYLSEAGGFVESSAGTPASNSPASYTVTLFRPSMGAPVRVPLGPQSSDSVWGRIPVFAGDHIRIDKVGVVYAVGAFKTQGGYPLKNSSRTTVIELIALAGGVGFEAASGDSHIVRKENGQQTLIDINVSKILKGTQPDLILQPDDILFVPTNQLKAAIKGGGPSIVVSIADAALFTK